MAAVIRWQISAVARAEGCRCAHPARSNAVPGRCKPREPEGSVSPSYLQTHSIPCESDIQVIDLAQLGDPLPCAEGISIEPGAQVCEYDPTGKTREEGDQVRNSPVTELSARLSIRADEPTTSNETAVGDDQIRMQQWVIPAPDGKQISRVEERGIRSLHSISKRKDLGTMNSPNRGHVPFAEK